MKKYVYTIVRTDLPTIGDIFAQAIHSALEAGREFQPLAPHVVCLQVKSRKQLYEAADYLVRCGIDFYLWAEPDWDQEVFGYTSLTTEPINEDKKFLFKKFKILSLC